MQETAYCVASEGKRSDTTEDDTHPEEFILKRKEERKEEGREEHFWMILSISTSLLIFTSNFDQEFLSIREPSREVKKLVLTGASVQR